MSSKPVIPRELATWDVDRAVTHDLTEGAESAALGFIDELEKAFTHIGQQAASGSPRYAHELNLPGLRFWRLTRYPYLVFYFERDDAVDIWRVLHEQRDIPAWMMEPA